jgi:PST family polysaccharide transporter/lipopolysaccharide exporter
VSTTESWAEQGSEEQISPEGLRRRTLEGLKWVTLARGIVELLTIAAGVALAHLIRPADFGRLAVAVIVSELALALAAQGVGSNLIQRRAFDREDLQSTVLLGVGLGLALMLATLFLAPLLTTPLFGRRTSELFRLFSPIFVLEGLKVVPEALLQRRLDFRRLSIVEMVRSVVAAVTAVSLAAEGIGVRSFIIGGLVASLLSLLLLLRFAPIPRPRWHPREFREILAFGAPAGFASLAWVGYRNIDYAILGATLSPAKVGFYYRAFNLGVENEQRISSIIARIAFPVYARSGSLEHMRTVRAKIMRINATAVFPLLVLFIALAPVVVPSVFGARWEPAVLPAQILAVAGMAAMINNGTGPILLAAGRPGALSIINLLQFVLYALTVLVAAHHGLVTVCIAVTIFQIVALFATYVFALPALVGTARNQLCADVGPALAGSLVALLVALALTWALRSAHAPAAVTVAVVSGVAGALYVVTMQRLFPGAWGDAELVMRRLTRRSKQAAVPLAESPAAVA